MTQSTHPVNAQGRPIDVSACKFIDREDKIWLYQLPDGNYFLFRDGNDFDGQPTEITTLELAHQFFEQFVAEDRAQA